MTTAIRFSDNMEMVEKKFSLYSRECESISCSVGRSVPSLKINVVTSGASVRQAYDMVNQSRKLERLVLLYGTW